MAQVINTNIASLNAQRNLNSSQGQLNVALERLSSGLRINSAKDDAAGLAITERFTAQINGLNQAVRNSNDGISYAQTAEGALDEASNLLQRIRELAVQSANDTNSSSDRAALDQEVQQAIEEIDRIARDTQFNDQNILDGSLRELFFQVGANRGQTIEVGGVDTRAEKLGGQIANGGTFDNEALAEVREGTLTINGEPVDIAEDATPDDIVNAINAISATTGVDADRGSETVTEAFAMQTGDDLGEDEVLTFTLNGTQIRLEGGEDGIDGADMPAAIERAINNASTETGVRAELDDGEMVLRASNTRDIVLEDFSSSDDDFDEFGDVFGGEPFPDPDDEGMVAFYSPIEMTTALGETPRIAFEDSEGDPADFLGFEEVDDVLNMGFEEDTIDNVSVRTRQDASDTIRTVDYALQTVNGVRADLGAVQNRFEATVSNLSITSENLSASRSRIQDADFAAETAELTRGQILQQAGTTVLAQANQIPNNVLSLLQ